MLRHYQSAAVSAVQSHWAAGRRRIVLVLPTGAGKTQCAQALQPDLAIVHTRTLADQTRRLMPGVTVRTVQSIVRRGRPLDCRVVFIDECHHIAAGAWRRLMALLPADCHVVGCTATPERADGAPLADLFDALVSTTSYTELLSAGFLAPCDVVPSRGLSPAAAYLEFGQGRPGILFAPTIADCTAAVAALRSAGVTADTITADTPARQRTARFLAFELGKLDVLCSPSALAEGFDSPRAAVCVLGVSCEHVGTYLQRANRVTRPHPSKTMGAPALLLDCTGAAERHGHPTIDRTYSLSGEPIRRADATQRRAAPAIAPVAQVALVKPWERLDSRTGVARGAPVRAPAVAAARWGGALLGAIARSLGWAA